MKFTARCLILSLSLLAFIGAEQSRANAADANPFPTFSSGIVARYLPSGYSKTSTGNGTWAAVAGNETATVTWSGTDPSVDTVSNSNGATKSFQVVTGSRNVNISYPTDVLNQANYSLITVARWNSSSTCVAGTVQSPTGRNRIFQGQTGNWLSGFWACTNAVSFHENWLTQSNTDTYGNNWIISTDCGYDATYINNSNYCSSRYRAQGADVTSVSGNTDGAVHHLAVNGAGTYNLETSNFQIAEVIVLSRNISILEATKLETYLARNYGITLNSGSATKLGVYTSTNGGAVVNYGSSYSTQPQIVIQDSNGQTVTTDTGTTITASVSSGGVLLGTVSAPTINGIATFSNLGLYGTPGATYTVTYSASGLISTTETVQMAGTTIAGTAAVLSSSPTNKLGSVTLTASVNRPATVTFYWNNRIINRCGSVLTSGTVPNLTAICTWKPLVQGQQSVRAVAAPSDSGFTTATSNTLNLVIGKRAGAR
jgi:hypothetical protein